MNEFKAMVTAKQLENLKKRKPFGNRPGMRPVPKSPGRPRTREFVAALRLIYEQQPTAANMNRLIRCMERRCPQEIAHYLAGKPGEMITLDATVTAEVTQREVIEAAAAAARALLGVQEPPQNPPLSLPSP